jgi:hypothetical protein
MKARPGTLDRTYRLCSTLRPKAYFAMTHVAKNANKATTAADGIVELLVPAPVLDTMFPPQTAVKRTASHTTAIASDAHISVRLSTTRQVGQLGAAGSWDMVPMASSFLSASASRVACVIASGPTQIDGAR